MYAPDPNKPKGKVGRPTGRGVRLTITVPARLMARFDHWRGPRYEPMNTSLRKLMDDGLRSNGVGDNP
jgi:hypothetical protein